MKIGTLTAAIAIASASGTLAQTANFDSETEGFQGPSLLTSGINIFGVNGNSGLNPDGSTFGPGDYGTEVVIERAIVVFNDFPDVVTPDNMLGFGGSFVPGDSVTINLLTEVFFATDSTETYCGVDIVHYENGPWGGIRVIMEGLDRGSVVTSSEFTISDLGGRDNPTATRLEISDAAGFDTVRIHAQFADGTQTVFTALMDNLTFDEPSCPADTNGDGVVSPADFNALILNFNAGC
jgi:hypothetical protein